MTVTTTVRATSARIGEIQGLRALAVVLVVVYHAGLPVHGGFVGVDAFFVISGYVITRLLTRDLDTNGRIRLKRFYAARVRRLLPAGALVLTVTALAAMVIQSPLVQPFTGMTVIGAALWMGNAILFLTTGGYFSPSRETAPLLHMWSLAVEEQFYLFYPMLIMAAAAGTAGLVARRRQRTIALLVAVVVVSGFLSVAGSFSGNPVLESFTYYAPITRAWEFALGGLAFVVVKGMRTPLTAARREVMAFAGLVALGASAFLLSPHDHIPGYAVAFPTVGTALILASLSPGGEASASTAVGRVLSTAPLQRLGDLSYSWYLWHWPLIIFAGVGREPSALRSTIASLIALALADLTYRHVEERFRHATRPSLGRLLQTGVGLPILMGVVLIVGAHAGWGLAGIRDANEQLDARPAASETCLTRVPFEQRDMQACTFNADAPGTPIILLGDSTAAHITDGVREAALELNRPLTVATAQSCAFVDLRVETPDGLTGYCPSMYEKSVSWLKRQPPSTVLLENAGVWVDVDGISLADKEGAWQTSAAAKGDLWREALERSYADIRSAGHEVVEITPTPFFGEMGDAWSPRECTLAALASESGDCAASMSLTDADARQRHVLTAQRVATDESGVSLVDIRPEVCRGGTCATRFGNEWVFIDSVHLTVDASVALAPVFERALASDAAMPDADPDRPSGDGPAASTGNNADAAPNTREDGKESKVPEPDPALPPSKDERPDVTVPDEGDLPEVPDVPDVPEVPDLPDVPEVPDAPDVPDVPKAPSVASLAGVN